MKKFFIVVLALHVLVEGLVGATMAFSPQTLAPEAAKTELFALTALGFAALTMVSVVFWLWPYRRNLVALTIAVGTLATFHTAVSLSAALTSTMGNDFKPYILHVVFAVCFWILWARRRQLADA